MSGLLLQQKDKQEVKGSVYFLLRITYELVSEYSVWSGTLSYKAN